MFGFGEVRTHLGVVFGVFEVFGWVFRKMEKMIKKSRQCRGSYVMA